MLNFYSYLNQGQSLYFTQFNNQFNTAEVKKEETQQIKQQACHRKYSVISDEKRFELIKLVINQGLPVREASEMVELKLSTCKAIIKTYKETGRVGKKKERIKRGKVIRKPREKQINQQEELKKQLPKLGYTYMNCMQNHVPYSICYQQQYQGQPQFSYYPSQVKR